MTAAATAEPANNQALKTKPHPVYVSLMGITASGMVGIFTLVWSFRGESATVKTVTEHNAAQIDKLEVAVGSVDLLADLTAQNRRDISDLTSIVREMTRITITVQSDMVARGRELELLQQRVLTLESRRQP